MAASSLFRLPVPTGGLNSDASPEYLSNNEAPVLDNVLIQKGVIRQRGALNNFIPIGGLSPAAGERLFGTMVLGSNVLLVYEEDGDFTDGFRGDPKATGRRVYMDPAYSGSVAGAALSQAAVTGFTGTNAPMDHHSVTLAGTAYALNANGSVLKWTGTTAVPVMLVNGPSGGLHMATHLQRLFVVGTVWSSGSDALTWTDPLAAAAADTLAVWQDNTSGLTNQIVLGGDDGDRVVGIASVGHKLLIFKQRSIYELLGDGPSSFQVRKLSDNYGCVDARSILPSPDGCHFVSAEGLTFYGGYEFEVVSRDRVGEALRAELNVTRQPKYNRFSAGTVGPATVFSYGYTRCVFIGPKLLLLSCGEHYPGGTPIDRFTAIYDIANNAWTKLTTNALPRGADGGFGECLVTDVSSFFLGSVLGWDGRNLVYLSDVLRPASDSDTGLDAIHQTLAIPVRWHSKVAALSSPVSKAVVRHIYLDYSFQNDTAGVGDNGWEVSIADGLGNATTLTPQVLSGTDGQRQRAMFTVNGEYSELQIRVERVGTDECLGQIFDAAIEYVPAQKR
jgi:hypothetical protein